LLSKLKLTFLFSPFCFNIENIKHKILRTLIPKDFLNSRTMFMTISLCVVICEYYPLKCIGIGVCIITLFFIEIVLPPLFARYSPKSGLLLERYLLCDLLGGIRVKAFSAEGLRDLQATWKYV